MYLSTIQIQNFRSIQSLNLEFGKGVNLLVGENDSGKSTIIDAIKLVTGTHSNDWYRITKDDFHINGTNRAEEIKIVCVFKELTEDETAAFLEWTSIDDDKFYLKLTLTAKRKEKSESVSEVFYDIRAGEDEESGVINGEAKNKLKATYLKPLRDAEYELAPRKGSRLSQILSAHEIFQPKTGVIHALVETMNKANESVEDYFKTQEGKLVSDALNDTYLKEISLSSNPLNSKFEISKSELGRILEKLELIGFSSTAESNIGLGSSNLLFIAAEMLLLKKEIGYIGLKMALIEEIEAHIHPQLQINLIDFLNKQSSESGFQNIISTHSNSLASKVDLNNIVLCKNGKAFSLDSKLTKLAKSDYHFLARFLDDTKSNLFFANGILLVEGDAENLIIPTLAEIIELPLYKYGVSIVNVGSTALLRYAKIFQRNDGQQIGIKVSCISDRDIPPKEAKDYTYKIKRKKTGLIEDEYLLSDNRKTEDEYTPQQIDEIEKKKRLKYDGGDVKLFIGSTWTLEYEIAKSSIKEYFYLSVLLAIEFELNNDIADKKVFDQTKQKCTDDFEKWAAEKKSDAEIAVEIYAPLERELVSKAVTAQIFSRVIRKNKVSKETILKDPNLTYLVDAIKHAANV